METPNALKYVLAELQHMQWQWVELMQMAE